MVERGGSQYVPPGWPLEVNPPGSEDWETTAAAWLLDLVPEYRQYAWSGAILSSLPSLLATCSAAP